MNGVVKKAVVLTAGMGLRSLPATKAVPKACLLYTSDAADD